MISAFGKVLKRYRKENGDTLKTLASKLEIFVPYLSSMEVGRRLVTMEVVEKVKDIYNLSESQYDELYTSMLESNNKVDLELSKMNDAQREVSMTFARRIENADPELLEKLRKALSDD